MLTDLATFGTELVSHFQSFLATLNTPFRDLISQIGDNTWLEPFVDDAVRQFMPAGGFFSLPLSGILLGASLTIFVTISILKWLNIL